MCAEQFVNMQLAPTGVHPLCNSNLASPERPATQEGQKLKQSRQSLSGLEIENQETKNSLQGLQPQIKCKEWHIIT